MYDICTIGHITLDKVVTPQSEKYMPGGTSFYFSRAIQSFNLNYLLVTALSEGERYIVEDLKDEGIEVNVLPSRHTVFFENIYSFDQDHRDQNVLHTADPFGVSNMPDVDASYFHLGPLLADDISVELIQQLAQRGKVSLDIQGYLRFVSGQKVFYRDWAEKKQALPWITCLKANEFEMQAVTGTSDVRKGAEYLAALGVREVIITLGSRGSVIYADGRFTKVPAYAPAVVADATGCGDTYMAGFLSRRVKGASLEEAGKFGAAMATLKIQSSGPFTGTVSDVEKLIQSAVFTGQVTIPAY